MKKSSDTPITLICCGGARFYEYAHKKGEVVGPAGGETGVPRCLAEVRKLPKTAIFHYFDRLRKKSLTR